MPTLNLKPTHKSVKAYYESLDQFERLGVTHETAVRSAFQSLLEWCARQFKWTLVPEDRIPLGRNRRIFVDGALKDDFNLTHGHWEAKDIHDDLPTEVQRKVDVIFKTYSLGVSTNRDAWVRNFNRNTLAANMSRMIDTYNEQVFYWERRENRDANIDDFVVSDEAKIKWSYMLKQKLKARRTSAFSNAKIRKSLYRPFTKSNLYFDRVMNDAVSMFPSILPTPETEVENRVIIVSDHGFRAGFNTLMANLIPDLHTLAASDGFQCFPFYTYEEDGTNRRDNIADWALAKFRSYYQDDAITKWDIFHYVYGLLHHSDYREQYQANLKRELAPSPLRPGLLGICESRGTAGRNPRRLRRATRISAQLYRKP